MTQVPTVRGGAAMYCPIERYQLTRGKLRRLLAEVSASGWCDRTIYLTPTSSSVGRMQPRAGDTRRDKVASVLRHAGDSETGLALFMGHDRALAIAPPFPVTSQSESSGLDPSPLIELLAADHTVGIVLLRLGRYAVGVLEGEALVATKTGSRYVKSRHRAGGSSQRRFERSRERLVRELFDKTCEVVRAIFSPHEHSMDYILMGGERQTLRGFLQRCGYMRSLEERTLGRILSVARPSQATLDGIASEVWKSRVTAFEWRADR